MENIDKEVDEEVAEYAAEAQKLGVDLDSLREIPENAIYDYFPCDEYLVYVLDSTKLMSDQDGELLYLKATSNENGEIILNTLNDEELEKALSTYEEIQELFNEEE